MDGFGRNLTKGRRLEKEWPYKIFGEIAPGAPKKSGQKTSICLIFLSCPLRISTKLGKNKCILVLVNRFVAKFWFFPSRGRFSPKTNLKFWTQFWQLWSTFGVNNSKTVWRRKKHILCPLSDSITDNYCSEFWAPLQFLVFSMVPCGRLL